MSGGKIGVTPRQWRTLDAVRAYSNASATGRAWISDVVEFVSAEDDCTHGSAARAVTGLKRLGLLDVNDWRVWLTEAGRAFLETDNAKG